MPLDTSNLEATMDAAAIANGIANRKISDLTIEQLQANLVTYDEVKRKLDMDLRFGMITQTFYQTSIDRITEKAFLTQKHLDTVM